MREHRGPQIVEPPKSWTIKPTGGARARMPTIIVA
jgi:hypothetical protein